MVKGIKSNPVSKRDGVKKELSVNYQLVTDINLTAMPSLGLEAIAIYAIPLKFVEVVEIPLRSFTATAFPNLSKVLLNGQEGFNKMLYKYTFWSTILLFPLVLTLALFPVFFLSIIGGREYVSSIEAQRAILYVVCAYILLLPLDRYSGVALFAINRPDLNFYKITLMLVANIIFDCIAVFIFNSLFLVAMATLAFTVFGILLGWRTLYRQTGVKVNWQMGI